MDRIQQKQESRLQPKLSIIFKQQVNRIPQTFGAFYDGEENIVPLQQCQSASATMWKHTK